MLPDFVQRIGRTVAKSLHRHRLSGFAARGVLEFGPRRAQRLQTPLDRCIRVMPPRDQPVEPTNEIASTSDQSLSAPFRIFDRIADARLQLSAERFDPFEHLADL